MNYRGLDDLGRVVRDLQQRVGPVDAVVGIPRSGLLAAAVYALEVNAPLYDLSTFKRGWEPDHGERAVALSGTGRVLLLDDSVSSGRAMERALASLREAQPEQEIVTAAVFASHLARDRVDFAGEVVGTPRVFEWNMFHGAGIAGWCVDIDGVLCDDPPYGSEEDDDVAYVGHLREARVRVRPTGSVGTLVTNRLERHRELTERWLGQNGIRFGTLVMRPESTAAERRATGGYAEHKAAVYAQSDAELFIESSLEQATGIARITGKAVYCTDERVLVPPGGELRVPLSRGTPSAHVSRADRLQQIEALILRLGGPRAHRQAGKAYQRVRKLL